MNEQPDSEYSSRTDFGERLRMIFWRLLRIPSNLLGGARHWGWLRIVFALGMMIFLFILGSRVWMEAGTNPVRFYKFMSLRYWVFPLAGFLGAWLVAINFLRKLYQLPRFRLAWQYTRAAAFGIRYPRLVIENGEISLEGDEINLIDLIGGPGIIDVRPGSAVLLERLTTPTRALGAGCHFVSRLEHIREVASLEDQHGEIDEVMCVTKDGILVRVKDVQYRYRMRSGHLVVDYPRRTPEAPYPFSSRALGQYVYNRTVSTEGKASWAATVRFAVDGVITDYVREHQFDQLTTPREFDDRAREQIGIQLDATATRERLASMGAELLWCDIGHIEPVDRKVWDLRVGKWGVRWAGQALVTRAYAEAQRSAHLELGRAEAQANMFISVVKALEDVALEGDVQENLHNIIVLRTTQLLEAMTEHEESEE